MTDDDPGAPGYCWCGTRAEADDRIDAQRCYHHGDGQEHDVECPPVVSEGRSQATWCDGTPHHPKATPPLPFHDIRWDGDDPYTKCVRCGEVTDALSGRVVVTGSAS